MKLVILDRDGVINRDSDEYIKSAAEWEALPGSLEAITRLSQNGYRVVIASNQSGLARKKFSITDLHTIHRKMLDHLSQYGGTIDAIFFCPHGPRQGCECRKPKPGLLKQIASKLRTSLDDVPYIGDKLIDVETAINAGARPILVRTGKDGAQIKYEKLPDNVSVYQDLSEAVDDLLRTQ